MEKKKKDSNYIIPAKFFKDIFVEEKIDIPGKKIVQAKENNTNYQKDETKPVKLEVPKLKTVRKRNTTLSITSIARKKELDDTEVEYIDYSSMPKSEFTEIEFIKLWKQHCAELIKNGHKSLASIMNADRPRIDGFKIYLTLPTQMMKSQLETHKTVFLQFVRKKLNNYSIDLLIEVNEIVDKKFAYTPQEKFEKLKEKNPFLVEFRKKLDLDL